MILIDAYLLDARAREHQQGFGPMESVWLPDEPDSVGGRQPLRRNGRSGVHPWSEGHVSTTMAPHSCQSAR